MRPRALGPAILVLVALAPAAGCSSLRRAFAPAALRPLRYDPPPSARQTFTYSEDRSLRYNGHYRFVTPEGEVMKQLAGDFDSQVRSFKPPSADQPSIAVVAVSPFGTRVYYDAIMRVIGETRPDAVVCGIDVKEPAPPSPPGAGAASRPVAPEEERPPAASLRADLTNARNAIVADDRFAPLRIAAEDLRILEREGLDRSDSPSEEQLAEVRAAAADWGEDVILHNLVLRVFIGGFDGSRPPARFGVDPPPPDERATFESEAARVPAGPERRKLLVRAFNAHAVPRACLATIDASVAAGGRRIVVLVSPEAAGPLAWRLRGRGYEARPPRWLSAVPILSYEGRIKSP